MNQPSAIEKLLALHPGTEVWWDSSPLIYEAWRRDLVASNPALHGALERFWRPGSADGLLRGCTTNPPLAWQAIEADRESWDRWARERAASAQSLAELLWTVYGEVCDRGAALVEPVYTASRGRFGHICAQVDPRQLTDLEAMLAQARRLHALRPNIMIKMPATKEGIEGLRILSSEGISTTATLCFSVAQAVAVAEAARAGYAEARRKGIDLNGCRCCAALMMGRMEDVPLFKQQAAERGLELTEADLRWAGVAVARKIYRLYRERGYEARLLCASMRLGPVVAGEQHIWHLEKLTGGEMVLTIFPNILAAFFQLYAQRPLEPQIEEPVPDAVLDKLLRIPYFVQAYEEKGVAPEEFIHLPGVQATGSSFAQSMQTIEDYVRAIYRPQA